MTLVVGVDATKKGWVAVVVEDGAFVEAQPFSTIAELASQRPDVAVIGVDIPIGLPDSGRRVADIEARELVGPRRSSVFFTHPQAVIEAETYAEAREIAKQRFGAGISAQAYALRSKILEVDAIAQSDNRIIEVHPEVSFRELAGTHLLHSKRTWNGQMERRQLLADAEITLPGHLTEAGDTPVDDVLDAAVCAWTAARYLAGSAQSMPDPPETNDAGRQMAIWR